MDLSEPAPRRSRWATALAALAAAALAATPAAAQSLRGSRESVERAYATAKARGLPFHATRRAVARAARAGGYVRLVDGSGYRLSGVSAPYLLPATAAWLGALATRYSAACGAPLTVTSAIRPTALRFRNSVAESVHPTGMAVDVDVPRPRRCRAWLRAALLEMERGGAIDATEERTPAHFHVVVYGAPAAARP